MPTYVLSERGLTASRIAQIRRYLPAGFSDMPINELRLP